MFRRKQIDMTDPAFIERGRRILIAADTVIRANAFEDEFPLRDVIRYAKREFGIRVRADEALIAVKCRMESLGIPYAEETVK